MNNALIYTIYIKSNKIDKNMRQIATLTQLHDLQNSTWIYAVVVCAIAIFVAYLVSNMIAWQGGMIDHI